MKKYEKVFFVLGVCMLLSELAKQLILTFCVNGGHYDWWYFPFQLCSLPMYLLTLFPFLKSRKAKQDILAFLMTYNLLGGIAVFFDTSGMHYPLAILTAHSFIWHILLILIGLGAGMLLLNSLSGAEKNARLTWRTFFRCTLLYFCFCFLASLINLLLSPFGEINMFYVNPAYKMSQVFFHYFAETFGNLAGISLYILGTVTGSFLIFLIWKLIWKLRTDAA